MNTEVLQDTLHLHSRSTDTVDVGARIRLDKLEGEMASLKRELHKNTELTRTIAINTTELVTLVKGVKGFRTFVVWVAPIIVGVSATIAYFRSN